MSQKAIYKGFIISQQFNSVFGNRTANSSKLASTITAYPISIMDYILPIRHFDKTQKSHKVTSQKCWRENILDFSECLPPTGATLFAIRSLTH